MEKYCGRNSIQKRNPRVTLMYSEPQNINYNLIFLPLGPWSWAIFMSFTISVHSKTSNSFMHLQNPWFCKLILELVNFILSEDDVLCFAIISLWMEGSSIVCNPGNSLTWDIMKVIISSYYMSESWFTRRIRYAVTLTLKMSDIMTWHYHFVCIICYPYWDILWKL